MDLTVRRTSPAWNIRSILPISIYSVTTDFGLVGSGYMHLCLEYVGPKSLRMDFSKLGGGAAQNDITPRARDVRSFG